MQLDVTCDKMLFATKERGDRGMENYNEFIMNDKKFFVEYEREKNIIWAITHVDGKKIKEYGDTQETAYWALRQTVYQELNVKM